MSRPNIDISCGTRQDTCNACMTHSYDVNDGTKPKSDTVNPDLKNIRIRSFVFCLCKSCREKLKELL